MSQLPFQLSVEEILEEYDCNVQVGLSRAKIHQLRVKYGPNKLTTEEKVFLYFISF